MKEKLIKHQFKFDEIDFHEKKRIKEKKITNVKKCLLKIVIKIGRHDQEKKIRLRPTVGAKLVKKDWKVEFGENFLIVLDKIKKAT